MNYPILEKLYYKNKKEYEEEYLKRFNNISTIKFDIEINKNPAFIIITPEILNQIFNILTLNNKLSQLTYTLPKIALDQYIKRCLIEEIVLTNEIEGVISTRRDIAEILENTSKTDNHKRLSGLVNKYVKLGKKENLNLQTCQDIREIYNDLVFEEIFANDKNDLPDGIYFRKNSVSVLSTFGKEIHEGVMPEDEINKKMTQSLDILNNEKINILIRIALFHYFFGYIHPFYDGNGRVSRFISSFLLSKHFNILTGYRLAYTIKENISMYYNSFKIANEQKNKGDLTPFIINFFDILIKMLENLYSDLLEKFELIDYYYKISEKLSNGKSQNQSVIFVLFQETLFGNDGLSISKLVKYAETSEYKVRQVISDLKELNLIKEIKFGKKLLYSFDLDILRELDF